MSWQAPNLLDKIFAKPVVPDSNVIGNFMGGYMSGKSAAKENQGAKDFNAGASASNAALDALGSAGLVSTEGSTRTPLMPEKNWMQTWAQGTMDGKAAASDWLGYQQARTVDRVNQSHLELATADLAIKRNLIETQANNKQGEAILAQTMSKLGQTGQWNDPQARSAVWKVAEQFPGLLNTPIWQNIQENFQKADKAALEADKYRSQFEAAEERRKISEERLGLEQKRVDIANDKANQGSPQLRLLDEARQKEIMAEQARKAGDTEAYQNLTNEAKALRSEVGGKNGISIGSDDQGRPIINIGGGGRSEATVATKSRAQEKLIKYENVSQLLTTLENGLRPMDVGAAGVVGEYVGDRILPQIPGFEGSLNGKRVENRAILGASRESLLREISDDNRFSNKDREDISKILPSSGVFESHGDAMQRIKTVKKIVADRSRTYAERVGEPVPLFAQSKEEIKSGAKKRIESIRASMTAGTITKEQADAEMQKVSDEAINALVKFH